VGGTWPVVTADQVRQAIAHSFNVALEAMVVAAAEPEDFIVFLPDVTTANQVFNRGAPLQASPCSSNGGPGSPTLRRRRC
jgi:hypothetical protein